MKDHIKELSDLTRKACESCPETGFRCCDKKFCEFVKASLGDASNKYVWNSESEVPYMGSHGCVVAPKDRPFCTGFVCNSHLKDRKFRREYERLCEKAKIPSMTKSLAMDL